MTSIVKYLLFIFFIPIFQTLSQTDSTYLEAEDALENILQEPTGEVDNSNLYEIVEQLIRNPLDLNKSDADDLMQIPQVDLEIAKLILNHRKKYGVFFSVEELHSIQGFAFLGTLYVILQGK